MQKFETDRLVVRAIGLEDAEFLLQLVNSPKWIANIGDRKVYNTKAAEDYIRDKMLPQFEKVGYGNYVIITKNSQAKIGTVGLYDREGLEGVDIGFALLPDYEGFGYGYESASRHMNLGIEKYGLTRVAAITTKGNLPSQRLIQKLGLRFEKYVRLPNDAEELMLYSWSQFAD